MVAVSTADGTARTLVQAASIAGLTSPERVVVISDSGMQLATTLCSTGVDFVGDCRPTAIVDIASGALLRTLDLGGRQPSMQTTDWLLAGDSGGEELIDSQGRQLWSTASFGPGAGAWATQLSPDRRLIIEIRSIAGNVNPVLIAVDPSTGRQTTLYSPRISVASGQTCRPTTW